MAVTGNRTQDCLYVKQAVLSSIPSDSQKKRKSCAKESIHIHTVFLPLLTATILCTLFLPSSANLHGLLGKANFGWASGVLLHFLTMYPDLKLSSKTRLGDDPSAKQPKSNLSTHPFPHVPSRSILSINPADDAASETSGDDGNSTMPTPVSRGRNYTWIAAPILMVAAGVVLVLCLIWCRWLFVAGETRYWSRVQNEHLQAAGQSGGGGDSRSEEETTRNNRNGGRESSEEIDEHDDNDRRELFSSFDV